MKLRRPKVVGAVAVLLLTIIGVSVIAVWLHIIFGPWQQQMKAGAACMDSLTATDIQSWIERTQRYLAEHNPTQSAMGSVEIPPDLAALKIIRIDVDRESVAYLWMGGMDHTELVIERQQDRGFRVTAGYSDNNRRVIWQGTPANLQRVANERLPLTLDTNRASAAPASKRSP